MNLEEICPVLISKIDGQVEELRDLVVVDENYDDIDSEELDVFDPDEYNFLVYVTERVQEALGEEGMIILLDKLASPGKFIQFYAPENDIYGIRDEGTEEDVARKIVTLIEKEIVCRNS